MNRKGPNTSLAQESVYATHAAAVSCTTTHNVNGNLATHTNITLTSIDAMPTVSNNRTNMVKQPVRASASSSNVTGSGSSGLSSSASQSGSGKVLTKARSDEEQRAPPLPPRKAGDKKSLASNSAASSNATSMLNLSSSSANSEVSASRSTENITTLSDLEVPKTTAPPVPKHRTTTTIDTLAHDLHTTFVTPSTYNDEDYEVEAIIVGPAETITGIIDTRPLEARKPICSEVEKNNVYHLKTTTQTSTTTSPSMHIRHQSLPVNNTSINHNQRQTKPMMTMEPTVTEEKQATSTPVKHRTNNNNNNKLQSEQSSAPTLPITNTSTNTTTTTATTTSNNSTTSSPPKVASVQAQAPTPSSTSSSQRSGAGSGVITTATANSSTSSVTTAAATSHQRVQPQRPTSTPPQSNFVYENMTINPVEDCNSVPYENINLEYIARLMNEGYSKEHVVTALGISRNNIEVAYDMLHVFVKKSGGNHG